MPSEKIILCGVCGRMYPESHLQKFNEIEFESDEYDIEVTPEEEWKNLGLHKVENATMDTARSCIYCGNGEQYIEAPTSTRFAGIYVPSGVWDIISQVIERYGVPPGDISYKKKRSGVLLYGDDLTQEKLLTLSDQCTTIEREMADDGLYGAAEDARQAASTLSRADIIDPTTDDEILENAPIQT